MGAASVFVVGVLAGRVVAEAVFDDELESGCERIPGGAGGAAARLGGWGVDGQSVEDVCGRGDADGCGGVRGEAGVFEELEKTFGRSGAGFGVDDAGPCGEDEVNVLIIGAVGDAVPPFGSLCEVGGLVCVGRGRSGADVAVS
jgi:hypothetical protein